VTASNIELLLDAIIQDGYAITSDLLPTELTNKLAVKITALKDSELHAAGIGRGASQQNNNKIRLDKTKWLETSNDIDNEFLTFMESLRLKFNEALFLGLFDFEAHYAIYKKNTFYKKHFDALEGKSNRALSVVVYLNTHWPDGDGGELVLYNQQDTKKIQIVKPELGTAVFFLSEKFPHEVLAAKQTRYSIAGWFRINASSSSIIDTM